MSKISKALMSLFLDKRARTVLENNHGHAKATPSSPSHARAAQRPQTQAEIKRELDGKIDEIHNRPAKNTSLSRQELITQAKRVRAQKQDVLADLSEEQRLKLQVLAMKAMMPTKSNAPEN